MAEVIGFLREDNATAGEKAVLNLLENGLPNDFWVYVECPIPTEKIHRFPDFIVVCNFGVVVLEVKDWISIKEFDNYSVKVFQGGVYRTDKNPVLTARDYAIALNNRLQRIPSLVDQHTRKCSVPWGYAVVFPNLPMSIITQMRQIWGDQYVLNKDDLEPYLVTQRLKATVPRNSTLHKEELQFVRGAINPVVILDNAGKRLNPASNKPAVILDEVQERLVVEHVQQYKSAITKQEVIHQQESLFESIHTENGETAEKLHASSLNSSIVVQDEISENLSVRLVRGFAGSGKSLVLQQRARYLKAKHPEWNILVLTYNEKPASKLQKTLKKQGIEVIHFHKICRRYLPLENRDMTIGDPDGWVEHWKSKYPIVLQLGSSFVAKEIRWIMEMGFNTIDTYKAVERKGRGAEGRLNRSLREEIYSVFIDYLKFLNDSHMLDWAQVPHLALKSINDKTIEPDLFNVILIDEAQDFAPSWIAVVKQMLKPEQGLLFLADDPMQSIYRYYSWREKGVPVVGRTRWLRVPYRNTREIYQAAYEVIRTDETLKVAIETETGLSIEPDIDTLRHGTKPKLHHFEKLENEANFIRFEVDRLRLLGYEVDDIVVLARKKSGVKKLQNLLRGSGIMIETFHALKGLEFEVVFLSQLQDTFNNLVEDQDLSQERRLIYMAMTRPRSELHLCFEGTWPEQLKGVLEYIDR